MPLAQSTRPAWFTLSRQAGAARVSRNFVWTLCGNSFGAAAQWALVVLLARLGDAAMVGQYTLGLAITSPIFTLASLNLRSLQATDSTGQFRFADYLGIRLVAATLAVLATAGVVLFGSYSIETAMVVAGVAAMKFIDAMSETVYGRWHQREQMDRIAQSMILRGAISIVLLSALVWYTRSAAGGVAGLAIVSLGVLALYDLQRLDIGRRVRVPSFDAVWTKIWSLARVAGPLGLAPMLVSVNSFQSRYWLAHERSEADVGLYSALAYVTIAANLVVVALGQAAGPSMTRSLDHGDRHSFFRQAARLGVVALGLGLAGVAGAMLWGGPLMRFCYGEAYARHAGALVWLMGAGAFNYLASCAGYTLSSARRFLVQLPILCTSGVVIAIGSWLLIPGRGVEGAAMAQAAGSGVQCVLNLAMVALLYRRW